MKIFVKRASDYLYSQNMIFLFHNMYFQDILLLNLINIYDSPKKGNYFRKKNFFWSDYVYITWSFFPFQIRFLMKKSSSRTFVLNCFWMIWVYQEIAIIFIWFKLLMTHIIHDKISQTFTKKETWIKKL